MKNEIISQHAYTVFEDINELNMDTQKNYLFDLSDFSVLNVLGDRAAEFLQGQITCDVNLVTNSFMQTGSFCNLKGRVMAVADVVKTECFKLILPKTIINQTKKILEKPALFSRIKLETQQSCILGYYCQNPQDTFPAMLPIPQNKGEVIFDGSTCCYNLGDNFYIILLNDIKLSQEIKQDFIQKKQFCGSLAWHYIRLKNRDITIYPSTMGMFLPHRLEFDKKGYVSFTKGCYKGQEIIARTEYLAKTKHIFKLYKICSSKAIFAGETLFHPEQNIPIGELVDLCPSYNNNQWLIACILLIEHPKKIRLGNINELIELHEF